MSDLKWGIQYIDWPNSKFKKTNPLNQLRGSGEIPNDSVVDLLYVP